MEFNRFDICDAYYMYYVLWHNAGHTVRDLKRSGRSISTQLSRMRFHPAHNLELETMSENGLIIYLELVEKHEHTVDEDAHKILEGRMLND